MVLNQKELIDELRFEWKKLWNDRLNDKIRAEGIAVDDYSSLFIDKGTIIHATRDFKVLNFKEILKQYEVKDIEKYISPDPHIGGWNKFIKDNIKKKSKGKTPADFLGKGQNKNRQKKNVRGWLHF